jgi:hypothetical protein
MTWLLAAELLAIGFGVGFVCGGALFLWAANYVRLPW